MQLWIGILPQPRDEGLAMISSYSPTLRRRLLSKHFLISSMPEEALDDLVKFSTVARFEAHRPIFSKGDPGDCLYGILSGRVRIYSNSAEGDEILLNVMEPGELFGEVALLDGSTRTASAAAMEQAALLRIHRDHFLPYVRANPDLILGMLVLLCQRLRWTSSMIEDAAFLAFPARLAKRLLVLAEHYRKPEERDITVPLSQHDLGNMVGAGREAINKQLSLWRSAGIVDTGRGAIVIRNCEALQALVGCA
jgi:CRP/FNR family transcriptional regulator, cyclic AMP receptor protein